MPAVVSLAGNWKRLTFNGDFLISANPCSLYGIVVISGTPNIQISDGVGNIVCAGFSPTQFGFIQFPITLSNSLIVSNSGGGELVIIWGP